MDSAVKSFVRCVGLMEPVLVQCRFVAILVAMIPRGGSHTWPLPILNGPETENSSKTSGRISSWLCNGLTSLETETATPSSDMVVDPKRGCFTSGGKIPLIQLSTPTAG